jgi:methionyl-tRNA formyltransferase
MKIVFMGTPDFAVESLKALVTSGHDVCAVVTVADKRQGRGLKVKSSAVKLYALENNIPIIQPENLKDPAFANQLKHYSADCFVVVAFKILPREIFTIPKLGTVNVHGSLLPAYRGAAPINWAIMNGDTETGVTTMLIDAKVDTGDILLQDKVTISGSMTAGDLHDILAVKGARILIETLKMLSRKQINPLPQDDSKATKAPKIKTQTALIDFDQPAMKVHNHIRGLSPYPGAYTFINKKKIKLLKSEITTGSKTTAAGTIIAIENNTFKISCSVGALTIYEVQLEGKRKMDSFDFLNGYKIETGDFFTEHL